MITAGLPRKPGMTREDLVAVNAQIIREVIEKVVPTRPEAIVILVTNPLDTMVYLAKKVSGFRASGSSGRRAFWTVPACAPS